MVADRIAFGDDLFRPLGEDVDRVFGSAADWVGDGKGLSDRLWLARKMDRKAIDDILRAGLATGKGPLAVARDLEDYLLPAGRPVRNPETGRIVKWKRDATGKLLRDARGRLIPANAKGVLTRTPRSGMGSYAARRLARTEVSRAFNQGVIQAATLNPFVEGVKWNKSSSHHEEDICDEYAQGHSAGMEPGEYRIDEFPRMPGHPHCLCYVTTVQTKSSDDVVDQLKRDVSLEDTPAEDEPFTGLDDADDWAQEHFSRWADAVVKRPDIRQAIAEYKDHRYRAINNYLRGRPDINAAQAKKMIKPLDAAFRLHGDLGGLDREITVYRGMGQSGLNEILQGDLSQITGTIFKDKGYPSASLSQEFGAQRARAVVAEIRVPKGSRVLYSDQDEVRTTSMNFEHEIILPRDSSFRILSATREGNKTYVVMEML